MNHLPLIIKREYLTKVKNKAFLIMTILSPLIFIALIAVVAYLSQLNNDSQRHISVLDESGYLTDVFKDSKEIKYDILEGKQLEDAKQIVKTNDNYGLLYIEEINDLSDAKNKVQFYSKETPALSLISDLEKLIETELTHKNLANKGIDTKLIDDSKIRIDISQENFSGEKSSKFDSVVKLAFGGAAGYLLFMFML